jgi:hypothetical protein
MSTPNISNNGRLRITAGNRTGGTGLGGRAKKHRPAIFKDLTTDDARDILCCFAYLMDTERTMGEGRQASMFTTQTTADMHRGDASRR